jgi:TPP-dependent 2-oxoacid decarboxylase
MANLASSTVGQYVAARLQQTGVKHYFAVPGDYNLVLLDELLKRRDLTMISACNELNAAYAADGYARATGGLAAVVFTFSVGGISAINGIAGAYAESLPVIAISGGPNTNSEADNELLHHTIGLVDYSYQREMFARVTAASIIIRHAREAPAQIDQAIDTALRLRKPVYLEVPSNLAGAATSVPGPRTLGAIPAPDTAALIAAADHASEVLNAAVKPALVAGVGLRANRAEAAFVALADASGHAVAAMPNAKSFFPEDHPGYIGTYWGPVSSSGCSEIIESADLVLYAGPTFTDYTTAGHTDVLDPNKMIIAQATGVAIGGQSYGDVPLSAFLAELAGKVKRNTASLDAFNRIREETVPPHDGGDEAITTRQMFDRIQKMLTSDSAVIAETGDSWFNGMRLRLPQGARFEIQMQYGSIGWSVGATLGYALGTPRRVITLVGDGSFQMTAQEVSTMIRYDLRPIIFLINNGGYTIEVEIHDGPYNAIKNWDYAGLVDVFNAGEGKGWGTRATTQNQLDAAIARALDHDGLSLIEVIIDRDDCSKDLLEWGRHVAANNGRPPRTT